MKMVNERREDHVQKDFGSTTRRAADSASLCSFGISRSKEEKEVRLAQKVKAAVLKLGKGSNARVRVKLNDKTKLAGYISEVKDDSFVLVVSKTDAATDIAYIEVAGVQGHNLSTRVSVAIGIGIGVALFFLSALILQSTGHLG